MEELRIFLNITIQASSTLFFSPGSVSHMHRCLHDCVWEAHKCVGDYEYICICRRLMWMLWVFVHHPSPYSTNETGSLSWTQNLPIQLVWFTSLLQGSQLYILGNGMIDRPPCLPIMWVTSALSSEPPSQPQTLFLTASRYHFGCLRFTRWWWQLVIVKENLCGFWLKATSSTLKANFVVLLGCFKCFS